MKISQYIFQAETGWRKCKGGEITPDILLAFGSGRDCSGDILVNWWQKTFPQAQLLGCSGAGEILDTEVHNNSIVVTAIQFEKSSFKLHEINFEAQADSFETAKQLVQGVDTENLKLCFVLSDGLNINGSQLVAGLKQFLPANTLITGGLAGDGKRFSETLVCLNENFSSRKIVLLALYGEHIDVEYGSMGGWDSFGPTRLVTRSESNVLFSLDNQNALALYKKYLGPYAKDLPSSGLRFPLQVTTPDGQKIVRTILAVDEDAGTMTFAGDIPEGSYAELMRANLDRLIDGALGAAQAITHKSNQPPELAILISCVGRRLVLGQRIEEEVEAIRDSFGINTTLTGFYSYGEICPYADKKEAVLHNQTMTITTLRERV